MCGVVWCVVLCEMCVCVCMSVGEWEGGGGCKKVKIIIIIIIIVIIIIIINITYLLQYYTLTTLLYIRCDWLNHHHWNIIPMEAIHPTQNMWE